MSDPAQSAAHTGRGRQPGDPSPRKRIEQIIRVDQAGEYGAMRIYAGQLAVMRRRRSDKRSLRAVEAMAAQEQRHLDRFNAMMIERRVRPTLLQPFWHVAGFALGAATAMLGDRAAMACTVAVEQVIEEHYAGQAQALGEDEAPLRATIDEFRRDEAEHREQALQHGAERAPAYGMLSSGIKAASRLAIYLSTRL